MARPSKKAISKAQEASKALDRIFAEVDPNLILAGLLGGTASAGGLIPPFTRLLSVVGEAGTVQDYQTLFEVVKDGGYGYMGPGGVIPALFALYSGLNRDSDNPTPPETIGQGALFASGALEAMLMYRAFSNPEVMKSVLALPGDVLKGIGEIVPG